MIKKLLFAFLMLVGTSAFAADRYVCSTGGSDSNNGQTTGTAWAGLAPGNPAITFLNQASAGDKLYVCRNGTWSNVQFNWRSSNCQGGNITGCVANPPEILPYGSGSKPVFNGPVGIDAVISFTGGSVVSNGGYKISNIRFQGNGAAGSYGIFSNNGVRDITLDGIEVDGFSIGLYLGDDTYNVFLTNFTINNNHDQGILSNILSGFHVFNGTFDNNGGQGADPARPYLYHSIYDTCNNNKTCYNRHYRNITITNNGEYSGICESVPFVVHGIIYGMIIEYVTVYQDPNTSSTGCWAINVDDGYLGVYPEGLYNVIVRNNTLINVGGNAIACSACDNFLIENNTIVHNHNVALYGILIPDRQFYAGNATTTRATVRNNTFYFSTTPRYSGGIAMYNVDRGNNAGNNLTVQGNIIYFGTAVFAGDYTCFDTRTLTLSNFDNFSNNTCYDVSGNGTWDLRGTPIDSNRLTTNPQITTPSAGNSYNVAPSSGASPSVDSANSTYSSPYDINRCPRSSTPDRGSTEYTASACTQVPYAPRSWSYP